MAFEKVKEHMKKEKMENCCGEEGASHPDHSKELHRINRISGQLEAVKRMISDREYCPKILTQIQAIRAALKSLEAVVLERHLSMCVRETLNAKDQNEATKKMDELMELFRRS